MKSNKKVEVPVKNTTECKKILASVGFGVLSFFIYGCAGNFPIKNSVEDQSPDSISLNSLPEKVTAKEQAIRSYKMTEEDRRLYKKLYPETGGLTEEQVREKMRQVPIGKKKLRVMKNQPLASGFQIPSPQREFKWHPGGAKTHLVMRPQEHNGMRLKKSTGNFQGKLLLSEPGQLVIQDSLTSKKLVFDFAQTPKSSFEGLKNVGKVEGNWHYKNIHSGEVHGLVMSDTKGLLFASESRAWNARLTTKALAGIVITQKLDTLPGLIYRTNCEKLYFPDVKVSSPNGETVIVEHGRFSMIRHGQENYLITIIRSEYREDVECDVSFEDAPHVLEYTMQRVNNFNLVKGYLGKIGNRDSYKKSYNRLKRNRTSNWDGLD